MQTIAVFAMNEKGGGAGSTTPLPPGVVSNRVNASGGSAQTATVILFDRLNILEPQDSGGDALSGLGAGAQARTGRQVLELLASLKASDKLGLYSLFQDVTVVRDFTEDSEPLIEAAKRASASPSTTAGTPAGQALDMTLRDALTPGHPIEHSVRAQITARAFRAIARRMDGVPGRKSLIWITSSFPLIYGDASHRNNDEAELNNMANILGDANIALYSIDPRGAGTAFSQTAPATRDDTAYSEGRATPTKGREQLKSLDTVTQSASGLSGVEGIQLVANQTGGKAFIDVNDIAAPIREVMDAADVSYTLGYYVDDKTLDGKKHDVSVKLSKRADTSGVKLSYRKSYLAAAHREHPDIKDLTADRLDANRIGVMAVAFPAPNRPGVDAVQVRVDVKDLQFEKRADKWSTSFDLALAIESGGEPSLGQPQ